MSVASRPVSTGKTRTCPHCKATILESLSICPGCMHHLRFDSEAAKRQVAAAPALRVEGIIRHPPLEQPLEYFVIIAIRNDRGEEVTRQVVNVGALQAAEKRTFTLSVEVLPPQAPVPTKSNASTGTFKSPVPQATVRPSVPANPTSAAPSAGQPTSGSTASTGSVPGGGTLAAGAAAAGSGTVGAGTPATGSGTPAATGATAGNPGAARPPGSSLPQTPSGQGAQPSQGAAPNPSSSLNAPPGPGSNTPRPPGGNPVRPSGPNPGRVSGPNTVKPPTTPPNPAGSATPANPANPANPTAPASPAKPASGYVLKPPSPGGPKRH
jgi:hypothetical protein